MKDYQKVRTNLINMLEDLEESLDEIVRQENIIENQDDEKNIEIEIEPTPPSNRFNIKSGKINSK